MDLEPVIGLEIHVELATSSKLFCGCVNRFGQNINTQVCPVCLGLPGTLPVTNEKAVELLLNAAIGLECEIPKRSKFDRKNYFYPDMPKNYQISQYDLPLAVHGKLRIHWNEQEHTIRIHRIHLEEDTGKSTHIAGIGGRIHESLYTLLDYNRAGVPLIEIVTEPDLQSEEQAVLFLQKLRLTLQTLGISDCKMEEGRMRCDANISVRPKNTTALGVKVEVKNMNSFKSVRDALCFEIERQTKRLSQGEKLEQETRGWNEDKKFTFSMRSKEEAHDYRYFPEPDLPPFEIKPEQLEAIRSTMPELPEAKMNRYRRTYALPVEYAETLVNDAALSAFFEASVGLWNQPKEICNWLRGDISKYLNETGLEISETRLTPANLVQLLQLVDNGTISGKIGKELLPDLLKDGHSPSALVEKKGLAQISDPESLKQIIQDILKEPASAKGVEEYKAGNTRALGFFVGAVMKKTAGKANPKLVNDLLKESLNGK